MTIRVLIADDQVMVRQGFTVLLNAEPGIEVVGQAVDGLDALAKADELDPDVVLMDIRMPGLGGIEATRRITAPSPELSEQGGTPSHRQGPGADHLRPRRVRVRGAARGRVRLSAQGRLGGRTRPGGQSGGGRRRPARPEHHQAPDSRVLPDGRRSPRPPSRTGSAA
ncbi:hypothetical protein GCM10020000_65610 [Streptomyces olivoverticillatus]